MQLDAEKFWIDWQPVGFGLLQFTCFAREVRAPVGLAWCMASGIRYASESVRGIQIDLLDIYVPASHRRQGVAWAIHRAMFGSYGAALVKTQNGSAAGGLKLIQAAGYQRIVEAGEWVLNNRDFRQLDKERRKRKANKPCDTPSRSTASRSRAG